MFIFFTLKKILHRLRITGIPVLKSWASMDFFTILFYLSAIAHATTNWSTFTAENYPFWYLQDTVQQKVKAFFRSSWILHQYRHDKSSHSRMPKYVITSNAVNKFSVKESVAYRLFASRYDAPTHEWSTKHSGEVTLGTTLNGSKR